MVAAGAGFVSIPADFGAGCGFGFMLYEVMAQRRNLVVSGVVAAGAGLVSIPADCGTGRCLRFMLDKIVSQSCYFDLMIMETMGGRT